MKKLIVLVLLAIALTSCVSESQSSRLEREATERNQSQLNVAQPVPGFDFSQERDTLIQVYKLRNEARSTWTVFLSDMGQPIYTCPSVGFPVPGGTQLTNPLKIEYARGGTPVIVPQAEPNGTYTDPNTNSTYVLCLRDNNDIVPVYAEPKVMTFPFPIEIKDGRVVEVKGAPSSATVQVKRGE